MSKTLRERERADVQDFYQSTHKVSTVFSHICQILSPVDRASRYNLVNGANLVHNLFVVYFLNFIYNLYVFRTSPGPSSGGTAVFMRHLVLVIVYSWLSGMQDSYQSAIQNNKYQVSHKYSCSSWWWTWRGPKHVGVINKIEEIHKE